MTSVQKVAQGIATGWRELAAAGDGGRVEAVVRRIEQAPRLEAAEYRAAVLIYRGASGGGR